MPDHERGRGVRVAWVDFRVGPTYSDCEERNDYDSWSELEVDEWIHGLVEHVRYEAAPPTAFGHTASNDPLRHFGNLAWDG